MEGWEQFNIDEEEIAKLNAENQEKARAFATKFHQVFVQNPIGAELLGIMTNAFVMTPIVTPDSTQFEAGIKAGRADVVHQILKNIKIAENPGGENVE